MADEREMTGGAVEAIGARQTALESRHTAAADADRILRDAIAKAHANTVEATRRLDAIAADIDAAVINQESLALDTAIGAREFQKFLLAKQQEISAVVDEARELDNASRAALDTLRERYSDS